MSIFASKAVFMQLGLEQVAPSNTRMYQDCYICKDPLNVNECSSSSAKHHPAVRIGVCGHLHGRECLAAWLDAGNSCPICKRMLFEPSGQSISRADINGVVHVLGRLVGKKRVKASIARLVDKRESECDQLRRTREEDAKKFEVKEAQVDDMVDDDYWVESGDEDFSMDEDDDGDIAIDLEDA